MIVFNSSFCFFLLFVFIDLALRYWSVYWYRYDFGRLPTPTMVLPWPHLQVFLWLWFAWHCEVTTAECGVADCHTKPLYQCSLQDCVGQTSLSLGGQLLTGTIPDLSNLKETLSGFIDFISNQLTGKHFSTTATVTSQCQCDQTTVFSPSMFLPDRHPPSKPGFSHQFSVLLASANEPNHWFNTKLTGLAHNSNGL